MEGNQPVVIDNGSGIIKAGFAGADKPRVVFRSIVGRTKHVRVMPGGALEGSEVFVGTRAEEHRGALLLNYPLEHGVVQNWADMERLWAHVYSKEHLSVAAEDHAVMLTEAPLNPTSHRARAAEVFFEGFNAPALYCAVQAVLSLYASGRTTGVVLDVGDGVTHAVPVYEGFALPHAITRMDVAGRDVTQHLQLLLRRAGYSLLTSAETEVVRQVKESCCLVAPASLDEQESTGAVTAGVVHAKTTYVLPDGSSLEMTSEVHRAPELLFQPSLGGFEAGGAHDCLVMAVAKSDMDVRRALLSQVVLAGGSTLLRGFGERLLSEVRRHKLAPRDAKIRIAAPPERQFSTWIGGSILASLSTFRQIWVTRAEYEEHGAIRLAPSQQL